MDSINALADSIEDKSVLEGVKRVAEEIGENVPMARQRMRKLLGKDSLTKKKNRRCPMDHIKLRAKGGRPKKGNSTLSDLELMALLDGHTRETCRWSARWARPVRTLTKSFAAVHQSDNKINSHISYKQLCRRAAKGGLAVCRPFRQTDKCDICQMFDFNCRSKIVAVLAKWRRELTSIEA